MPASTLPTVSETSIIAVICASVFVGIGVRCVKGAASAVQGVRVDQGSLLLIRQLCLCVLSLVD